VARYFFDSRDGDTFSRDDIGDDLPNLERVKVVATRALAELARDVPPGSVKRKLSIEVRQGEWPVLMLSLTFEAIVLADVA
jgi:hypothetical protein